MADNYSEKLHKARVADKVFKGVIYVLLSIWAVFVIFPFFWMILTSFKTLSDYSAETVPQFYTLNPTFENYVTAFTSVALGQYMINTVIFAVITTVLMVIVSTLAAFAFARLEFRGKNLVFTLFLSMMMIPNELVIITNYATITNLGWRNSFQGLILPSVLSVFYIYLLRQNFMQVPDEVYYAAKMDGCSDFKYLTHVLVPLSKPTFVTIIILKLIECWNSYVWPRLITYDANYYLVSNGIQEIKQNGFGRSNIPAMMAAVTAVSLPLLVIYIIFRKQIMAGVSRSGLKG